MKIILLYNKKVPLTENINKIVESKLSNHQIIITDSYEKLYKELPDTDILITGKFTEEMLTVSKNLKWVNALSAGVDNYNLDLFKNNNIIFTNSSGLHKIHMAEYAIMSMIMLARNMNFFMKNQHRKNWDYNIPQNETFGKTVGILGLGAIGTQTAIYSKNLGMKVIGINSTGAIKNEHIDEAYTLKDIDTVLSQSDYIVNLLPSSQVTKYLLSLDKMKLMKKSSCFINMGRGDIIKTETLYKVLKDNIISGAISDVFEVEPLPSDSLLWDLDNLIITPHICGASDTYLEKGLTLFIENFKNYLSGNDVFNRVV